MYKTCKIQVRYIYFPKLLCKTVLGILEIQLAFKKGKQLYKDKTDPTNPTSSWPWYLRWKWATKLKKKRKRKSHPKWPDGNLFKSSVYLVCLMEVRKDKFYDSEENDVTEESLHLSDTGKSQEQETRQNLCCNYHTHVFVIFPMSKTKWTSPLRSIYISSFLWVEQTTRKHK